MRGRSPPLKSSSSLLGRSFALSLAAVLGSSAAVFACSGVSPDDTLVNGGSDDGGAGDGSSSSRRDAGSRRDSGIVVDGGCTGLGCQHDDCSATSDTTITGIAYAPNGITPLYNVIVYVPSDTKPLAPFAAGVSCDQCGTVDGTPVTSTTTDATGHFTLHNAPSGTSIPLIFQLGKWRRQIQVATVTKCTENPLTDANLTRLPKNQAEGDMPHIAISSGKCDNTACLLPKLGIDPAEYGTEADIDTKRIIFYAADGADAPTGAATAQSLWGNETELKKFDAVILGCNCTEDPAQSPDAGAPMLSGMADYLSRGGRALTLDFQYPWTEYGPAPMPATMQGFVGGAPEATSGTSYSINDATPKGAAAKAWLEAGDSTYTGGAIALSTVFQNFSHVDSTRAQSWVGDATNDVVMSYTMPLTQPADQRCGKMTYFDAHLGSTDVVSSTFPLGCTTTFTQEQRMYAFFFMDLFSCVQDDLKSPVLPK